MPEEREKIFRELTSLLFAFPLEEYLSSDDFSVFCREHAVCDAWSEYLVLSRDTPDLYGRAVMKNAFVLFLHHLFHSRPGEFPALVADLLTALPPVILRELPVGNLKAALGRLGYPKDVLDPVFSPLETRVRNQQITDCPR